jgi:hypothetical protein
MPGEIGGRLRYEVGAKEALIAQGSPYAAVHDSRSGFSVPYRYSPREVGNNGGTPIIHYPVAEKIAFGIERYAPVTLPDTARVLMPDGSMQVIKGSTTEPWRHDGSQRDLATSLPKEPCIHSRTQAARSFR